MNKDSYALLTGLFLIIFISLSVGIAMWLGNFQARTHTFMVTTQGDVIGLKVGSTVLYRGIAVGKVSAIQFDQNDQKTILIPIAIDTHINLSQGVYATLRYKGVTGLTQIELNDSGTNPTPIQPGIKSAFRIPIKPDLLNRLADSGEAVLLKANQLMINLNRLLKDKNTRQVEKILSNLEAVSNQFNKLQIQASHALSGLPGLASESQNTLQNINRLSSDVSDLVQQLNHITPKLDSLLVTGLTASERLIKTTLPRTDVLLLELQSATQHVKRVATLLENNPQALLLGREILHPGPGEPGFKEPQ